MAAVPVDDRVPARRRAYWQRTLYQWHWLSSAVCLVTLVLFSVTGFTLNHPGAIGAKPVVTTREGTLPHGLLDSLRAKRDGKAPLPAPVADWFASTLDVPVKGREAEWSADEVYVPLPRPGGDAWASIALADGEVRYERTDRGWIAYLNDLHKGRNTGPWWSWFIDVFAGACLLFSLTGLALLWLHGRGRPATWPMVGLGVVLPLVVALLFIH